jgi:2-iminobutanoate/2-iminopropanoate deaminase
MTFIPLIPEGSAPPLGPYSPAIDTGEFVFFSGQLGLLSDGILANETIESEFLQALNNVVLLLDAAKLERTHIVKVTLYLKDLSNFKRINELYAEFFGDHKPARTTIEISNLPLGASVEIEVIAKRN